MISVLTGKDEAILLSKLDPLVISEKWKNSYGIDVGSKFRNLTSIDYWKCPSTGFCWFTPHEAAGGGELYSQLESFNWYYMKDKWEFTAALDLLNISSVVLEVGVGEGYFLQAARSQGHTVQGVEMNPKAAARVRQMDFEIHELMLDDLKEKTGPRYDAICAFQVLEHVSNPRRFLESMLEMLKPNGKIILSVPNAAVMRKIDPFSEDLFNQPPHHMGHWDEDIFRSLQHFLPLVVQSVHFEPLASYHVSWVVKGYLQNLLSPWGKTFTKFVVNRYSTLPLQWLVHGFRKYIPGHTLLVELEYLPN